MDRFYDERVKTLEYDKNVKKKKRPRVLWSGSGAHFDTTNAGYDDFTHIVDTVKKTLKKYQWVFMGAVPKTLASHVKSGEIEFHPWVPIYDYPSTVHNLHATVAIAPLHDNPFNNSKSDLKYIEAGAMGTPVICQSMHTYKNTPLTFSTGDELVDQIDYVVRTKNDYMKWVRKFRSGVESRWLEDNIDVYTELYTHPYNSPGRNKIKQLNCT
jgi:glycosyltransferase involved in cell wall biosynthesis